ncbi:MAG TPA: transcriptional repressor LexA [Ktedonobacterales bacterium]
MANLSNLQAEIYEFIRDYIQREGRPPTNREIGAQVKIESTGHVDYHLSVLEKKGYIARDRKKSRGIRIVGQQPGGLVIAGTIAAGQPLDIAQESSERLDLGVHTREYVLRVRGTSMIDDQIADGDCVLVDPDAYVGEGDIIVATQRTGSGEAAAATLKRLYREKDGVRLQPANATMQPIFVGADEWDRDWKVQGKVTAVYRRC